MSAEKEPMKGYPLEAGAGYLLEKIQMLAEACVWVAPIGRFHSFYSLKSRKPVKGYMVCMRIRNNAETSFSRTLFLAPKACGGRGHWHSKFKERYCKFDTYGAALHAAINYYEERMKR